MEITSVGFVEFHIIGLPTAHAAYRNNFSLADSVKKVLKSKVSKRRSKEGFTKLILT